MAEGKPDLQKNGSTYQLPTLNTRLVPDIRPFLISGIRPDIRFHLPDIRLAGYRISGSSIHEIVDIVSNGNYILLKSKKLRKLKERNNRRIKRNKNKFLGVESEKGIYTICVIPVSGQICIRYNPT